jgi:hypothetical protein
LKISSSSFIIIYTNRIKQEYSLVTPPSPLSFNDLSDHFLLSNPLLLFNVLHEEEVLLVSAHGLEILIYSLVHLFEGRLLLHISGHIVAKGLAYIILCSILKGGRLADLLRAQKVRVWFFWGLFSFSALGSDRIEGLKNYDKKSGDD